MTSKTRRIMGRFVLALGVLLFPAIASWAADTSDCIALTWVPTGIVIKKPGYYCLTGDINTGPNFIQGAAITVERGNSVTIDFRGHVPNNAETFPLVTQAIGIQADNVSQFTIRNGWIEGFKTGISYNGEGLLDVIIEDMRMDLAGETAISLVGPDGAILRHNYISSAGNDINTTIGQAIAVRDTDDIRVLDNDILTTNTNKGMKSYGIHVSASTRALVEGNRVSADPTRTGTSYGIVLDPDVSLSALVVNNRIYLETYGVVISGQWNYRDNLTEGCGTPYTGGTNVGNNE